MAQRRKVTPSIIGRQMRMLVDEKQEKRLGTSQEESKIFIYFILKSIDLFIEENVVSLFHWALFVLNFDFVSKKYKLCQYH